LRRQWQQQVGGNSMSVASTPAQWGVLMVIKHRMFKQKMNDQVQNLELLGRKKLRKLDDLG